VQSKVFDDAADAELKSRFPTFDGVIANDEAEPFFKKEQ